jgi:hypothetical protein
VAVVEGVGKEVTPQVEWELQQAEIALQKPFTRLTLV